MNKTSKRGNLSQKDVDAIVVAQANDESAWEKPIRVRRAKSTTISLPAELAARAAFFARLHHEATVEDWLRRIVQERVELEEAAFAGVKRDLAIRNDSA